MPVPEPVVAVVREWVEKADNDLKNAAHTLKLGSECPTDTVCFHAQQCVEKYLKALLTLHRVDFPKTHDIQALVRLLPRHLYVPFSEEDQELLTEYATGPRYPGWDEISLAEARKTVRVARHVRKQVRGLLPPVARRRLRLRARGAARPPRR